MTMAPRRIVFLFFNQLTCSVFVSSCFVFGLCVCVCVFFFSHVFTFLHFYVIFCAGAIAAAVLFNVWHVLLFGHVLAYLFIERRRR